MEDNKNPSPAVGEASKNNEANGESRNRRRRGHRGGRNHKRHRENSQATDSSVTQTPAPEQKEQKEQKPKNEGSRAEDKGNRQPKNNGGNNGNHNKKAEKKNDGHTKKHNPKNDKRPPDHFTHKDDIYGDPKEEKELADWRAKIVLNAELPTKKPPLVPTIPEEPVEIPEGTDLFDSPVLHTEKKADGEKIEVIGIRFRSAGKMYYFDPQGTKVNKGDFAIVETARGPEFGDVCMANTMVNVSETVTPLRPLIRVATPEDITHNEENRKKETEALSICQKKIEEHKLDMKLIDVQYAFDNSKLLFYFSSEGRVDFRELVKDLASVFRTRIELRQIGIRDEAKMLGGLGACGRALCCSTFLPDFAQVSIKMAKEQGLSLNSAKISGMCGRLMCCLRFESDVYTEEIRRTPSNGSTVKTEDGIGTVISSNPLAGTVRVVLKDTPDAPPRQYHRDTLTVLPKDKRQADSQNESISEESSSQSED